MKTERHLIQHIYDKMHMVKDTKKTPNTSDNTCIIGCWNFSPCAI